MTTRRSNTISVIKTGAMTMGMCLLLFSPGQAHALRDNRKLLFGPVGGAVTSLGASALNGLGIDNDCDGNSGFDKLCQAIPGGGDTVNAVAATAINKGIESYLGKRKLLFGSVGGAVTSLGAKAINEVGIDNDCEGDKGFDKLCQAIPGGGDTVNAVAATAINKGIESYLGK